jgi:Helix-turn-helix domain of transposase family ISL3/Transposase
MRWKIRALSYPRYRTAEKYGICLALNTGQPWCRDLSSALSGLWSEDRTVGAVTFQGPFSKRFEDIVGRACESASVRQVARQFGLSESTVRTIDQRYLQRWAKSCWQPGLRQMGVDEIYLGKKRKFITVVSNLQSGEPIWFGEDRKKETLDQFFQKHLSTFQR